MTIEDLMEMDPLADQCEVARRLIHTWLSAAHAAVAAWQPRPCPPLWRGAVHEPYVRIVP